MISVLAAAVLSVATLRAETGIASALSAAAASSSGGLTQSAAAQAQSPSAQALSGTAAVVDEAQDGIYYGPDLGSKDASGAVAVQPQLGSYLSHARITAFAWGSPQRELAGAEVVLNGEYLGKSPLVLQGLLVAGAAPAKVALRLDGYSEGLRPSVSLPQDGDLRVALLDDSAGAWISTPGWIAGLGLMGASVLAYRSESAQVGLGLAGGGIAVIAVSQLLLRWVALPALRHAVQAFNARPEAAPQP